MSKQVQPNQLQKLMKYLLFIYISLHAISCTQTTSKQETPQEILVDTSRIVIIQHDSTDNWAFNDGQPAELTSDDINKIERLIGICINEYNIPQQKRYDEEKRKYPEYELRIENYIIDLKRYKRQYVATTNSKGEKEVWVNCFCRTDVENWRKGILIVKDGGNCFFNLKINITKETFYDLMVNGDA